MSNQHSNEFQSGSAMYGRRKPYRIEERWPAAGGPKVHFADEYNDRDEALLVFGFVAHKSRTTHPENDFRPRSGKRLVLLGPDRTRIPEVTS